MESNKKKYSFIKIYLLLPFIKKTLLKLSKNFFCQYIWELSSAHFQADVKVITTATTLSSPASFFYYVLL